jgi:2-methylisocitrate lyase-like PEP mutase family enzyme
MASPALRQEIEKGGFITAPGVFELISALIADRMGFKALYVTGYGTVASALGLPDAGLASYSQMIDRIGRIVEMTKTPIIADADTGYGGLLNVRHTVRGYEKAGVTAIQIEDQEFPKKCGHTPDRRVIPIADMVRKIRVASDSRSSSDFLIVARTDARTGHGLDEAIRRGVAYAEAGADIIFIESPETEKELEECGAGSTSLCSPTWSTAAAACLPPKLRPWAFRLRFIRRSVCRGGVRTEPTRTCRKNGTTTNAVPMYSFAEFNKLIGFEDVWEFERRHAESRIAGRRRLIAVHDSTGFAT